MRLYYCAILALLVVASSCGSSRPFFGAYSSGTDETAEPSCRICTARRIPTDAGVDVVDGSVAGDAGP